MDKFIKECDCDLIQKLWDYNEDDLTHCKETGETKIYKSLGEGRYPIWLPSLSQIIDEIEKLPQLYSWNIQNSWNLQSTERYIRASIFTDVDVIEVKGKTPELACIKALKRALKEGK